MGAAFQTGPGRAADSYCPVTVVCGDRRLDAALPAMVTIADLQPSLMRLLIPAEEATAGRRWVLTPVGRADLTPDETLVQAGVLAADVLVLRTTDEPPDGGTRPGVVSTVRDAVEDAIDESGRFWSPLTTRHFTGWAAAVMAALLLLPAAGLPVGMASTLAAATVAVMLTTTVVWSTRGGETCHAVVGICVGCGWAALAGGLLTQSIAVTVRLAAPTGWAQVPVSPVLTAGTVAAAAFAALLLAGCTAAVHPVGLAPTAALLVVVAASGPVGVAAIRGAPIAVCAAVAAALVVLGLGGLPRAVLAVSGLSATAGRGDGPAPEDRIAPDHRVALDRRIDRADRALTGAIVGASLVAAAGGTVAALSDQLGVQALGGGIALALLLRSRAFSRVPHVLGPRIAGLLVCGGGWVALLRAAAAPTEVLLLGSGALIVALVVGSGTKEMTSVRRARIGRILDAAEQLLVVALIVLGAHV